MKLPRCGVRDNVGTSDIAKRKKRYALHGMYGVSDCLPGGLSKNNDLLIYYIRNMSNKSCWLMHNIELRDKYIIQLHSGY
jgi:hypothetical protein